MEITEAVRDWKKLCLKFKNRMICSLPASHPVFGIQESSFQYQDILRANNPEKKAEANSFLIFYYVDYRYWLIIFKYSNITSQISSRKTKM